MYGLSRTPNKNNLALQIYFVGGKVRSIDAELQKAWVHSKFYKSEDSTAISGSNVRGRPGLAPERRVMSSPEDFEAYQDTFSSNEPEFASPNPIGGTYDMLKKLASTSIKPKTNAQRLARPKDMVLKKKPVRKAITDKAASKPAPQYHRIFRWRELCKRPSQGR